MAEPDLGGIADRLYRGFMAPLVIGGPMQPGHPIGGKVAMLIGRERVAGDPELVSHVQLVRVRAARMIVPLDRLPDATPAEWTLAAALHDLVQSTHPDLSGAFRKKAPGKLLDLVEATIEKIAPPVSLAEAISRHTWFSRVLEIARTDVVVSWWVGSRKFLGEDPPARLLAWPELRRVNISKTPRALTELPAHGGAVDAVRLGNALARFLTRTPLTDLATATRNEPPFAWTQETLALTATPPGRTLACRALARSPQMAVDAALGKATRALFARKAWAAAQIAIDLLAERALSEALSPQTNVRTQEPPQDAAFARAAGAIGARDRIATGQISLPEDERRRALQQLEPAATSSAAKEIWEVLSSSSSEPPARKPPSAPPAE